MLKQSISWKGHNGLQMHKTLYFNLDRFEITHDMILEDLEARLKAFQRDVILDDEARTMTPAENREFLDIVKTIIRHAYGERSADGVEFEKEDPEVWRKFVATGAFNAFVWYLFEDPERANVFINGIWPEEVQEAAKQVRVDGPDLQVVRDVETVGYPDARIPDAPDDGIPSIENAGTHVKVELPEGTWVVKDSPGDYSDDELLSVSQEEFDAILEKFKSGNNVPTRLLVAAFQRKGGQGTAE